MAFESTFERDFYYLLEFDADVIGYKEQPIRVELKWNDSTWNYTPDTCVVRRSAKPLHYYEVKPSVNDFPEDKKKAMEYWCKVNDAKFEVVDASYIRGPALERVKFLYPYLRFSPDQNTCDAIRAHMKSNRDVTTRSLAEGVGCQLGDIYHLIALGELSVAGMPCGNAKISSDVSA